MKFVSAGEAVRRVKSHDRVFVRRGAAAPPRLISALKARAPELRGVEVVHLYPALERITTETERDELLGRVLKRPAPE